MEDHTKMSDDEYQNMNQSVNVEGGSGSVNVEGAFGHQDTTSNDQQQNKKEKPHKHTPQQIQALECFFKDNPYPDERQRAYLGKKIGMENENVKFWFQNRRTKLKVKQERRDNMYLSREIEKLRAENYMMKEGMAYTTCNKCGGPTINCQILQEVKQLRSENAYLKYEVSRRGASTSSASPMPLPTPNFGAMGRNVVDSSSNFSCMPFPMGHRVGEGVLGTPPPTLSGSRSTMRSIGNGAQHEKFMLVDLALAAMDELVEMVKPNSPFWIKSSNGMKEVLNREEYARLPSPYFSHKPAAGFVTEASRETGEVIINSSTLADTLMDASLWLEMFSSVVARAVTMDVISSGMNGTVNGALLMMHVGFQLPSPLVPIREMNIIRFCKKLAEGVWAVVDVSVDNGNPFIGCRRLPSGCVVQDISDGFSKVTWVDHSQYDESLIHQLYRPLVSSGIGFGAHRWVATLKRQSRFFSMLISSFIPSEDTPGLSQGGRTNLLKLAQHMTNYFWSGVYASSSCNWKFLRAGNSETGFTSWKHVNHGEALRNVISVATSVRMPVSRHVLFEFLRDVRYRGNWDIDGSKQEMVHISKGYGNCVSILGPYSNANNHVNESDLILLQESWTDSSGSMIVYSPITWKSFNMVVNGEDFTGVPLLPSGFAILPYGLSNNNGAGTSNGGGSNGDDGGCLLTFSLQMGVDDLQTANLAAELDVVNGFISNTIQKIKDALQVA